MRARELFQARARRAGERLREGGKPLWERFAGPVASALSDVAGIARAMVEIPAHYWLAAAEVAGQAVLAVGRALQPVLQAAGSAALTVLRIAARELTPARALAAVALAALATIAIAEFSHYRAVSLGAPDNSGVGEVAPAPRVDERTAGSAHSNLLLPLALVGAMVVVVSLRGRWRVARLLTVVGLIVVAVSLLNDRPEGLDEGGAAIEYEGAEAKLLAPFWAQLAGGAVLVVCGLLLPGRLRGQEERGLRREAATRPRPGPTGIVAGEGGAGAPGART